MFCELLVIGIALIGILFYKLSTQHARYFEERNLKCKGLLFWIKNTYSIISGQFDGFEVGQNIYNLFPDEPIFGVFSFHIRQYIVRDPEAFKRIAIKDFDHFPDHRVIVSEDVDPLTGNSLILMTGEKWRQMRATLSPAFTGSKMRHIFELVSECADDIIKHFLKKVENGETINIEAKDFFSRYTNDVIASCAFGHQINSIADPNNDFFTNGKELMNPGGFMQKIITFICIIFPRVAKLLNLQFFPRNISIGFKNMILDTMAMRKKNNIYRPDMINMLMQVREGNSDDKTEEESNEIPDGFATVEESDVGKARVTRKWTDTELVAQAFLFFIAGFESTSSTLTFAAYELMVNANIQQRLYEEIAEVNERLGGKPITYDALQKIKYLDQVVSETLRKYPLAIQVDRNCVKDYVYDDGERRFTIEKGSNVLFSLIGVHRDPKHYPEPEKFDPERFSEENKHNILSYVPFGVGPRGCIASRFALMEVKTILYYLLLNFSFEPNKDTVIPLKLKKIFFIVTEDVHLELKPRVKSKSPK